MKSPARAPVPGEDEPRWAAKRPGKQGVQVSARVRDALPAAHRVQFSDSCGANVPGLHALQLDAPRGLPVAEPAAHAMQPS